MKRETSKRKKVFSIISAALMLVLIIWVAWGNTALELNMYTVSSTRVPSAFCGFRIAHISDLHNTEIGTDNKTLLTILNDAKPDIIAITGDLIDFRKTNIEIALQFIHKAVEIAPCYYVTGNHEARISDYEDLKSGLEAAGVTVLENESVYLEHSGAYIRILGVNDPSFQTDYLLGDSETVIDSVLCELTSETDDFTVLLSHRPELFDTYVTNNIDLVLSGHTHGGQFRLPFIGGFLAPNQGLFPQYDAGLFVEENTNMIVSRGIGNSLFPFRFNNHPEVVFIELFSEKV